MVIVLFVNPKAAANASVPDKIFLLAINRKDGSIRWRKQIDGGNQQFTAKQNAASASPITDGKHVWTMTSNGRMTCLTMDGAEVFRRAVRVVVESSQQALERAGITADELALVIPHQANIRIIQAVVERLGIGIIFIIRTCCNPLHPSNVTAGTEIVAIAIDD